MNIFMFSTSDHLMNAKMLDDMLLNKMILETEQLLSIFCYLKNYDCKDLYKSCFINHYCQRWLQESDSNALWLLWQLKFYLVEYKNRFMREHKNILIYLEKSMICVNNLFEKITPFIGCFGNSGCQNYFDYYNWKKTKYKNIHRYTIY